MLDGRPIYRFRRRRSLALVYADDCEVFRWLSEAGAERIAAAGTGHPRLSHGSLLRRDSALARLGGWRLNVFALEAFRHAGKPTSLPYRGQKRWHLILGLIFGLVTWTWVFSGLLSMEPFDWLSNDDDGASRSQGRPAEHSCF
jgi:hypothetical protein